MGKSHNAVRVTVGEDSADIDVFIAPLIKKLWEMGINTTNSCENNVPEGFVWIQFCSVMDLENFLDQVSSYSEDVDSMYNRMRNGYSSCEEDEPMVWRYDIGVHDFGVEQNYTDDEDVEESFSGTHEFVAIPSVRFPRADVAEIMKNLSRS